MDDTSQSQEILRPNCRVRLPDGTTGTLFKVDSADNSALVRQETGNVCLRYSLHDLVPVRPEEENTKVSRAQRNTSPWRWKLAAGATIVVVLLFQVGIGMLKTYVRKEIKKAEPVSAERDVPQATWPRADALTYLIAVRQIEYGLWNDSENFSSQLEDILKATATGPELTKLERELRGAEKQRLSRTTMMQGTLKSQTVPKDFRFFHKAYMDMLVDAAGIQNLVFSAGEEGNWTYAGDLETSHRKLLENHREKWLRELDAALAIIGEVYGPDGNTLTNEATALKDKGSKSTKLFLDKIKGPGGWESAGPL